MAVDYNPDKEGHVKHKFVVQRGSLSTTPKDGVLTDEGKLHYGMEGRFLLNDEKKARAIQEEYGREVIVTRVKYPDEADRGHKYFFGAWPEMPWKNTGEEE